MEIQHVFHEEQYWSCKDLFIPTYIIGNPVTVSATVISSLVLPSLPLNGNRFLNTFSLRQNEHKRKKQSLGTFLPSKQAGREYNNNNIIIALEVIQISSRTRNSLLLDVMSFLLRLLLALVLVGFNCNNNCVDADVSPLQLRRLSATEGTFVRGLMMADHQFELYMTMTSDKEKKTKTMGSYRHRHYDSSRSGEIKTNVVSVSRGGGGNSSDIVSGTELHHAISQARAIAVNFADVLRRRAFSPSALSRRGR